MIRPDPLMQAYIELSTLFVKTKLHEDAFFRLTQLAELAEVSGRHKGAVLYGPSGAGKTTLIDRFETWIDERHGTDPEAPPSVVRVLVPADASPAALSRTILAAAGDPLFERGSGKDAERRLLWLLPSLLAFVFVLDEFQHLFEGKTDRAIKAVAQMLKNFVSRANRPVILVGLESIKDFILASPELKSRFSQFIELRKLSMTDTESLGDFMLILNTLSSVIPTDPHDYFKLSKTQLKFWLATEGGVGAVVELAKTSCQVGRSEGKQRVSEKHIAKAYKMMGSINPGVQDPFSLTEADLANLVVRSSKKTK